MYMDSILEVPELPHVTEVLHQHLELSHYIETYRQSTERVRWVIFVLMVLSVVVLVAQWNTASPSWLLHRLDKLKETVAATKDLPPDKADSTVERLTKGRFKNRAELTEMLDLYRAAVVDRVVLFEIPGIGVTFDINDLGLFSGVAFSLLLLLLVFGLMREYENLYLALFKVRRLHDAKVSLAGAESAANYLYHALAMSQVFSAPPTLAVWRPSPLKRAAPGIVFLLPAAIQLYIIITNYLSLPIAEAYGLSAKIMLPQCILFISVAALAVVAISYSKALDHRWQSAFMHINPSYRHVGGVPWSVWLRLPVRARSFGDHLQRRLAGQTVQRLRVTRDRFNGVIPVENEKNIAGDVITYKEVRDMGRALRNKAEDIAKRECRDYEFLRVNVEFSILHEQLWMVKARFDIRGQFKNDAKDQEDID
jgi:hypothetical protein